MYMETMEHIYSTATKVFVDNKNGNNVMYLPLDKLVEQNRQRLAEAGVGASGAVAAAAPQAASGAAAPAASDNAAAAAPGVAASAPAVAASQPAASGDSLRSRDAFRNRMREDDVQ
jgi:membrane protease subunit HflK